MDTTVATPRETVDERPVMTGPPAPPRRRGTALTSILVAAVVAALVAVTTAYGLVAWTNLGDAATTGQPVQQAPVAVGGNASANWVATIAKAVSPSVAKVAVTTAQGKAEGSAVIYRPDGYLLTNNHVVDGVSTVTVTLPSGKDYKATVVGTDPAADLAVIKINATNLPAATLATATPQIGEQVLAIGTPFGLSGTVTEGIISAKGRTVGEPTTSLKNMLQTDAAINPGNSGGALVNAQGQVVGIDTAILSPSGTNNGIGFAIPITTARTIAAQLIAHGSIIPGYLGIAGQTIDPQIASEYHLGVNHGAAVMQVEPGSPAADAGLTQGDIVTGVSGHKITTMEDLASTLIQHKPGDKVTLNVYRDGRQVQLHATLGKAPATSQTPATSQQSAPTIP